MLEKIKLAIYKYRLKKYSTCYFDNVYITKIDNEFHHVDYLLLTANEVMVIKCYDYEGNIYGSENISEWTQAINYNGYKFENPLRELKEICELIARVFDDVKITHYAVFSDRCSFPKSMPLNVIRRADLVQIVKDKYRPDIAMDCDDFTRFVQSGIRT